MFGTENLIIITGLSGTITIALLVMVLVSRIEKTRQLQSAVDNLKKSLDEMDEQAKLIVRTDMELNKTQEELDKKITGLYALQRLSRAISTTLDERQIFQRIDATYLEDLGFEKACSFLWADKEGNFSLYLNINYSEDEIKAIKSDVNLNKDLYIDLIHREKTISSISIQDSLLKDKINNVFKATSFVISPILPKEGSKGFLLVGTENIDIAITEGDEELITILTNQIGSSLENARLFEKTWRAHQELERKVEERTRELTLALDEVKNISKRKTDFISSVSHELRTPLTSIKGYASILLTGKLGALAPDAQERIGKINQHSDELVRLVNDLLDISRIESGKVIMKRAFCDLKSIIEEVLDLLSVQLKERQAGLSLNINKDAKDIFVDKDQIKRAFINIIGNAIKFIPPKGKITISSHKTDKTVQVDIVDTGCGIPEEAQKRIFEEFYRVDNLINQEIKGTGLGLSLVKHIIEAHDGKIWVKSKVGLGSTFSFTLPQ